MSLNGSTLSWGATYTPASGSTITFNEDGRNPADGISLACAEDTNLLLRRTAVFRATLPGLAANANAYAKLQRNYAVLSFPYIDENGKLYPQTCRLETAFHNDYTTKAEALGLFAGLASQAAFATFWSAANIT